MPPVMHTRLSCIRRHAHLICIASMQQSKQASRQAGMHARRQASRQASMQAIKQTSQPASNQASKQAGKQASRQASTPVSKQASKQAGKPACKQARQDTANQAPAALRHGDGQQAGSNADSGFLTAFSPRSTFRFDVTVSSKAPVCLTVCPPVIADGHASVMTWCRAKRL